MSAIASTSQTFDSTQNQSIVNGIVTLSGNYGTSSSHGDTLDLSALGLPSNQLPTLVEFYESSPAGALGSGNIFRYMPGTTQANGALQIFTAAGAEYTEASAYGTPPFSIAGFVLKFRASFLSFL